MFRDTQEELERLEKSLLEEEDENTDTADPEDLKDVFDTEDTEDAFEETQELSEFEPEETAPPDPGPYRNFANNYRAYNSDRTDVDLDAYSEEVRTPKKGVSCLAALALALLAGILLMLVLFVLKYRGIL